MEDEISSPHKPLKVSGRSDHYTWARLRSRLSSASRGSRSSAAELTERAIARGQLTGNVEAAWIAAPT